MGGNAITSSERIPASKYPTFSATILATLAPHFTLYEIPRSLPTKPSHGDLDIIVQSPLPLPGTTTPNLQSTFTHLATHWQSKQVVHGHPVTSFEVDGHQVDLIVAKGGEEEFRMMVDFMAWGDFGTLLGMMCKRLGLKYGVVGLECPISVVRRKKQKNNDSSRFNNDQSNASNKDVIEASTLNDDKGNSPLDDKDSTLDTDTSCETEHTFTWLTLSKNLPTILTYLGLDPTKWIQGFQDESDVFTYIAASKYFNPTHFTDTGVTSNLRKRIKGGRKMFVAFVEWSRERVEEGGLSLMPDGEHLSSLTRKQQSRWCAIDFFDKRGEADEILARGVSGLEKRERVREVFSGERVMALTGEKGGRLGRVVALFRKVVLTRALKDGEGGRVEVQEVFEDAVLGMGVREVEELILECAGRITH